MLGDDVGDETLMAEDARSTLLFQLSFIGGSELPDLEQCAREDAEMQRRTAHAIVAREEARQQDESQDDADLEQTMADWRHAQQQRLQELLAAASAEVVDSTPDLLSLTGLGLSDADEAAAALAASSSRSRLGLGDSNQQLSAVDEGPPLVPLIMEAVTAVDAERSNAAAAARQERQQRDNVRAQLQARESARMAIVRDLMGGSAGSAGSTGGASSAGSAHEALSRLLGGSAGGAGSASSAAAPSDPGPSGPSGSSAEVKAPAQAPLPLPTSAAAARFAAAWARDRIHGSGADGRSGADRVHESGAAFVGPRSIGPSSVPALAAVRAGGAGRNRAPTLLQRRAGSSGGGINGRGSRTERGAYAPAQRASSSAGGGAPAASASLPRCVAQHVCACMHALARGSPRSPPPVQRLTCPGPPLSLPLPPPARAERREPPPFGCNREAAPLLALLRPPQSFNSSISL